MDKVQKTILNVIYHRQNLLEFTISINCSFKHLDVPTNLTAELDNCIVKRIAKRFSL
jgi:hypothetical protein